MSVKTNKIKEITTILSIGSIGYSLLEIIWRGFTHWTMALLGGISFAFLYFINKKLAKRNIIVKCISGCLLITLLELIAGCIINKVFHLNVWDYSKKKFNVLGQVCLYYSLLWFLLCIPISFICRYINNKF